MGLLINKGADTAAKNGDGKTAFDLVVEEGHVGMVKLLLKSGSRYRRVSSLRGDQQGARRCGETAAGEGVDVEGSGHYEQAVLQEAIRKGREDLVRLVLQDGAGPKKTRAGHTALQITVMNGCGGVVRLLLDYGANVEGDN